jgi:hypothetical protein
MSGPRFDIFGRDQMLHRNTLPQLSAGSVRDGWSASAAGQARIMSERPDRKRDSQ